MDPSLKAKLNQIKLIVSDVDGILTDGTMFIGDGVELKQFTVEDGAGVAFSRLAGIPVALISGRYSKATEIRAKEMKIEHCYQGSLDKLTPFAEICEFYKVTPNEAAYIGDGLIDLSVMEKSGVPISVRNAYPPVKKAALYITDKNGGSGALREAVDLILQAKGLYEEAIKRMRKKIIKTSSG